MLKEEFKDILNLLTDKEITCLIYRCLNYTLEDISEIRHWNLSNAKYYSQRIAQKKSIDDCQEFIESLIQKTDFFN